MSNCCGTITTGGVSNEGRQGLDELSIHMRNHSSRKITYAADRKSLLVIN
jgi:hypothetical protein